MGHESLLQILQAENPSSNLYKLKLEPCDAEFREPEFHDAVDWLPPALDAVDIDARENFEAVGYPILLEGEDHCNNQRSTSATTKVAEIGTMPYKSWESHESHQAKAEPKGGSWGYCELDEMSRDEFHIRSETYLSSKRKQPAGAPLMRLLTMDWFQSEKTPSHMCGRKNSTCQKLLQRHDIDFVFAICLQAPAKPNYTMVAYYTPTGKIVEGSLLDRFINGDDAFRNERLKLIPRIAKGDGFGMVKRAVGSTPVLLGRKVDVEYYSGAGYFEINVNPESLAVARVATNLVIKYLSCIVMDYAWTIEGREKCELPERLLGTFRIVCLDLKGAVAPPPPDYVEEISRHDSAAC